jgi:uncharacterized protein (DUF302 family)
MTAIGMSVRLDVPLDEALRRARTALADQGFGILTEIDVAATLRTNLGVEVAPQVILGACNAPLAREGLRIEPDLGLLLPCNVVVRVDQDGTTLVSALDPELLVSIPGRPELAPIAAEAKTRLQTALATIAAASTAS